MENEIIQERKIDEENKNLRRKNIKLIILIMLIIILIITSFKSGERFFEIKNAGFDDSYSRVDSSVAYWYFDAKIELKD